MVLDGLLWWALLCNIKTLKSALFNLFWRRLIEHQVLNTPNFVVEVLLKRVPQSKLTTKNDWCELHEQVILSPPIDSNRCLIFNWIFIFDLFLSVHASAEVKRQIKIEVDHFKFNVRLYGFRNIKNIIQHEHTPPSVRSTFYLFCTNVNGWYGFTFVSASYKHINTWTMWMCVMRLNANTRPLMANNLICSLSKAFSVETSWKKQLLEHHLPLQAQMHERHQTHTHFN